MGSQNWPLFVQCHSDMLNVSVSIHPRSMPDVEKTHGTQTQEGKKKGGG